MAATVKVEKVKIHFYDFISIVPYTCSLFIQTVYGTDYDQVVLGAISRLIVNKFNRTLMPNTMIAVYVFIISFYTVRHIVFHVRSDQRYGSRFI